MLFMRQPIAMLGGKKHVGILFRNKMMHLVNMIALCVCVFFIPHFLAVEVFYSPIVSINAELNFPKRKEEKTEFSILF